MLSRRASRGFTLIELLVGMAIVALMVLMALPSMTAYFQNSKIGSASQTYLTGLQTARAEAIRRNAPIEFLLTDSDVSAGGIANSAALSPTGRNWVVRQCDTVTLQCTLIEARSALEGSGQAAGSTPSVGVAGTSLTPAPTFTGSVIFDGFGRNASGGETRLLIDNPAGGLCMPAGQMRCLNVRAAAGGQVRVCDPLLSAPDNRACV